MTHQDPAFTAKGRFWRGNLHTHSTRSDGVLSPEEVCRRYKAEGYDFMALTDHFVGAFGYPIVDTVPMRDAGFTTILGAELHSGAMANGELWHILAVGLPADFAPSNSPGLRTSIIPNLLSNCISIFNSSASTLIIISIDLSASNHALNPPSK